MRATVVMAALVVCLAAPTFAYDLQIKSGQAVCDTLRAFEELTIAITTDDDQFIAEMGNNGCHMPRPGLSMELIEAYPDETVLLFSKLAEYTRIGPVPGHVERLTHLAKVRVLTPDEASSVGFTLLRVSPRSAGQ
jgi:hypothetical protein